VQTVADTVGKKPDRQNHKWEGRRSSMSRDLIAEEARGRPGTVLNVPVNCGHSEETDREVHGR
jgi:hypothetical protein